VRTELQYDDAHIPGAICNPAVRAGFGTKLAWVADRDREIVLIGRDDADALRAARLAASVGITNLAGYLAGGMTSWREEKREGREPCQLDAGRVGRADRRAGTARAHRRRAGARRARAQRVGRGAHPGLRPHAL
jgi:rhodanese-related sulfurtransferase